MAVDEKWLRQILAEELAKAKGLASTAAEQIEKIRNGDLDLAPGVRASLRAMKRAIEEDRDPLA